MNKLIAIAVAFLTTSLASAAAELYPARPITVVVPYPAGGPTDTLARILADHMRTSLGQSVIIENVTGGGGSIGVGRVARAAADGYTVSIGHWNTHVVHGATLNLSFHVLNDFEPVALLADTPIWLVARKTLAPNDLKELIAWLQQNPGKATAGTVGVGGASDVNGAYFQNVTGTKFQFVPYRGSAPLNQDLVAGHIDLNLGDGGGELSPGAQRADQSLCHDGEDALVGRIRRSHDGRGRRAGTLCFVLARAVGAERNICASDRKAQFGGAGRVGRHSGATTVRRARSGNSAAGAADAAGARRPSES